MRVQCLFLCALIGVFFTLPAAALECTNSGTAAATDPDDDGDGLATACGDSAVAGGNESTALGQGATSEGNFSTALGNGASSVGESSIALGNGASTVGLTSVALGYGASTAGESSVALGLQTSAGGMQSAALGWTASSSGDFSVAIGWWARGQGSSSVAIGDSAQAPGGQSTALGFIAFAPQPNTIVLGPVPGVNSATIYQNVGMGTTNPTEAVDVERSSAAARFQLTGFTNTASEAPQFIQRRARGTTYTPEAVQENDNLGLFSFRGHNGTAMGGSRATITAQAAGTFSPTSTPTRLIFSTTPVGSTAPQSVLVITPDGKVQVKGVNLNVPDYVFEDDYQLMPLEELESFIDANGHLPGIASAQQVKGEGLDLAGSQMSQLQKIEELTLYTIQQQKRIDHLETQLAKVLAKLD